MIPMNRARLKMTAILMLMNHRNHLTMKMLFLGQEKYPFSCPCSIARGTHNDGRKGEVVVKLFKEDYYIFVCVRPISLKK